MNLPKEYGDPITAHAAYDGWYVVLDGKRHSIKWSQNADSESEADKNERFFRGTTGNWELKPTT